MEGNGIIQLINYMLENKEIINPLNISGMISIADEPGHRTIATEVIANGVMTFIVTLIATYIGSKKGSKDTVKLYKEEEKFKVKETLRREFYFEYEKLYINMYNDLKSVISQIKCSRIEVLLMTSFKDIDFNDINIEVDVCKIYPNKELSLDIIRENMKNIQIDNLRDSIEKLKFNLHKLKEFMELKGYVTRYKEFKYDSLESELSYISSLFNMVGIIEDSFNDDFISDSDVDNCLKDIDIILNKSIKKIVNQKQKVKEIHKNISYEFMESYFKD
ncbi:hypothetical protein [Romboutsia lituseburensis]|uniref:hypothetical protein n=1 Tax=Romboutsia lituseburensis TaxID=1537 RepID=UPI00215AD87A|nr:hypothetical protein [Romboutsia lituseburensis]MCR8745227.1 hypothetical protein [Romboutsia lituseburensis]